MFGTAPHKLFIGMEDNDRIILGIGVEFPGDKHTPHQYTDFSTWYPTFQFSTEEGAPVLSEKGLLNKGIENGFPVLRVVPNPLNSVATITFSGARRAATIQVMDIQGRCVAQFSHLCGSSVVWNGQGEPNGGYFVKLTSGQNVVTRKICLTR
jgi:hypothetical protein